MDGRWKKEQNVRQDAERFANNKPCEPRRRAPMHRMCPPEPIQKTNLIPAPSLSLVSSFDLSGPRPLVPERMRVLGGACPGFTSGGQVSEIALGLESEDGNAPPARALETNSGCGRTAEMWDFRITHPNRAFAKASADRPFPYVFSTGACRSVV